MHHGHLAVKEVGWASDEKLTNEEVAVLEVVGHESLLLGAPLLGQLIAHQEQVCHVHIRVFGQLVGLGMMLKVTEVPPVG